MNDIARKTDAKYQTLGVERLTSLGIPQMLAEVIYQQLKAFRNTVAEHQPELRNINPIELTDVEVVGTAWAFSADGINYYRMAVNEQPQLDELERRHSIRCDVTQEGVLNRKRFTEDQVMYVANTQFLDWVKERAQTYGIDVDDAAANLVAAVFYYSSLMPISVEVSSFSRSDGGLTVIFHLHDAIPSDPNSITTIRIDFYNDAFEAHAQ